MGRKRKRLDREEAWDAAKWLYRHFEAAGQHRTLLNDLLQVLRDLRLCFRSQTHGIACSASVY